MFSGAKHAGPNMPHRNMDMMHGDGSVHSNEADRFMQQGFGPTGHGPVHRPPPPMMQQPLHHRPQQAPMDPNQMAAEFAQLKAGDPNELAAEFERMMHHGGGGGGSGPPPQAMMRPHGPPTMHAPMGPHQWVHEFHQAQAPVVQQHHASPHAQQQQQQQQQWENVYNTAVHGPPSTYQPQHQAPWAQQFAGMGPMAHMMPPQTYMNMQQAPMQPVISSEAQGQQWATEFDATKTAETVAADAVDGETIPAPSSGGMGLNQDMINQFLNSDNPKYRNSKFIRFLDQVQKGEVEFVDNQVIHKTPETKEDEWASEFAGNLNPRQKAAEEWAHQYEQGLQGGIQSENMAGQQWAEDFDAARMAAYGDAYGDEFKDFDWAQELMKAQQYERKEDPTYQFASNNPFLDHPDPLAEGIRLMKEGDLKEAILAFEAAVQRTPDDAEAWKYLGQAQAENEQEAPAIAALLKAVSVDPYNLDALLMLGVSYTNDLEEARALNYLKTWLEHNPDFHGALGAHQERVKEYEEMYMGGSHGPVDSVLHEQVMKMFVEAASMAPQDADLQTVLGVLYHISGDYDKAIHAFDTAVQIRPQDPYLWNKLGATQANSSRSDQALRAYEKALELKPNYVRAHANRAIAFANQGLHREACSAYLKTLSLNTNAEHLWSYLRISLTHIDRDDLIDLTSRRDPNLFRDDIPF